MDRSPSNNIVTIFALLLASILASCSTVAKHDNATLTIGFTEAVFGLGVDPRSQHKTTRRDKVIRWDTKVPVSLSIRGENIYSPKGQEIFQRVKNVYAIAGITLLDHQKEGAGKLKFAISDNNVESVNGFLAPCYASIEKEEDGVILEARIVAIRVFIEDTESRCIEHEAMHTLGFGGHPHRLYSVLSYTQESQKVSADDLKLVEFLYGEQVAPNMEMSAVVSRFYNSLPPDSSVTKKRYTPLDISLEIEESESPLILRMPALSKATKRINFERNKLGGTTVTASYAGVNRNDAFANFTHTRLSTERIFPKQVKLKNYIENLREIFGSIEIREEGRVQNMWSTMHYMIGDTPDYSCLYTIKYKDAGSKDLGSHQLMYGYYCQDRGGIFTRSTARIFLENIDVRKIDPVKLRDERRYERDLQDISPLLITGNWPIDGNVVSAFVLLARAKFYNPLQMRVGSEICKGWVTGSPSSYTGDWEVNCDQHGNAKGVYFQTKGSELLFKGSIVESDSEVIWKGLKLQ